MSNKNKYRNKSPEDFLEYTGDQMSEPERNEFEKELEKDPFAAEALEGFAGISASDVFEDLEDLNHRMYKRLTIRRRVMINRITATAAAVLVAAASLLTVFHDQLGIFPSQVSLTEPSEKSKDIISYPSADDGITDEASGKKQAGEPDASQDDIRLDAVETESDDIAGAGETAGPGEADRSAISYQLEAEEMTEEISVEDLARAQSMEEAAAPVAFRKSGAEADRVGGLAISGSVITGVVISSEDSQPLPYAMISVKGTNLSAFTDLQGNFEIPVGEGGEITLVTDFIGMEAQEIKPEDQAGIMITMEPSRDASERVLIRGLGSKSRMSMPKAEKTAYADDSEVSSDIQSAEPIDGKRRFMNYVEDNMVFPDNTRLTRAVVVLSFVVDQNGRPTRITVLKSPEEAFSNEAIRLMVQGPDWVPGQKDGAYFQEETRIRMVFSP